MCRHTPPPVHTKAETFNFTEMEDQIHIDMALKNVQLHMLIILTREYLVYTQGQAVMKGRSHGQIKLNKQYQKTRRAGLLDELSKPWQESGRSSRLWKSNDLLSKTEKYNRCLSE